MADSYELDNGITHDHQLVHLGCSAHARRSIIRAEEGVLKAVRTLGRLATQFIVPIGKLFPAAEARSSK
ncbi:transposase IS66 [Burkholderia lata]|uniref:Transposase IS66 n=1 Tax=Burkholderia lata (strain ATCC 17760 / DSM 23089 / LMG 22485 / NCIMB 9086 / R18194 / 383) TaxID=482957 RepID=A0A6P2V3V9_BURL3|nr:transposase [Burkholderia lata]VWC76579.1 transposase IS66 [Burkholderia lata]